jgi:hypothetical protein
MHKIRVSSCLPVNHRFSIIALQSYDSLVTSCPFKVSAHFSPKHRNQSILREMSLAERINNHCDSKLFCNALGHVLEIDVVSELTRAMWPFRC